jgi:citronellyl-CoA dehydrogenase
MISFTAEHELFRTSLRNLIAAQVTPYSDEWEREGRLPVRDLFPRFGQAGFFRLAIPERFDGLGLDASFQLIWGEELGAIDSGGTAMALVAQSDTFTWSMAHYGSAEVRDKFLRPALDGEAIGAIAVTEPHAGSDVGAIATQARSDGDVYIINGVKSYVTNGGNADFVLMLCRTAAVTGTRGLSLIVIPADTAGVMRSGPGRYEKVGNLSCDHAEIELRQVRVPACYRLGWEDAGFEIITEQLERERFLLGVVAVAQAARIIAKAKRYARARIVFGQPLSSYQHISWQLTDLELEFECARQLAHRCAELSIAGQSASREVAMLKLKASRVLRMAAETGLQIHGASGYMDDASVGRAYRDSRSVALAGGTDEMMQRLLEHFLYAAGREDT